MVGAAIIHRQIFSIGLGATFFVSSIFTSMKLCETLHQRELRRQRLLAPSSNNDAETLQHAKEILQFID